MTTNGIRRVLLHASRHESFDRAARLAGQLVAGFAAELHVVYTIDEPLSAGWTAEMTPDKLPQLHQAMEEEARDRLARVIPESQQDNVVIAIRTGAAGDELVRYAAENTVDLAIVSGQDDQARVLLDKGRCSVLFLR
jgi:nucleotide-binding universal stress UspA family protein